MQVKLINYTQDALETLLYTKNTRLQAAATISDVKEWPLEKKLKELDYMLKTIQSSWEFVDYTFEITGVSRAFTHQLVRTRQGSYAQQSQRTVDMSECFDYVTPDGIKDFPDAKGAYDDAMDEINENYVHMISMAVPPQDARGILPTNVCTNIIAKFDLRTLSDMAKKRLCTRTQGEYQDIFKAMKAEIVKVHPWAEKFIRVYCSAVGVCQFANYKECPIKPYIFNPDNGSTWIDTPYYDVPDNHIALHSDYSPSSPEMTRPATKDEIEAGFLKMKFAATPLWKGNS
jgi:flavin-dependent thymidylate synthase